MVSISRVITEASNLVKATLATFALVAALSAFYIGAKSVMSIPGKLDEHSTVTVNGFKTLNSTLDKILCVTIADHRHMDWNLCFINPSEVLPLDQTK